VRATFALVEGWTAAIRRIALADGEAGVTEFTLGELAMLRGETYELEDSGEVRSKPVFQQLTRQLRFFRAFAKTYALPFTLEIGGGGWRSFKKALEIRNRITHPKQAMDLAVSDDDLEQCGRAHAWFIFQAVKLTELFTRSLRDSRPAVADDRAGESEGSG